MDFPTSDTLLTVLLPIALAFGVWCVKIQLSLNSLTETNKELTRSIGENSMKIDVLEKSDVTSRIFMARVETKLDMIMTAMRIKFVSDIPPLEVRDELSIPGDKI